MDLVLPFAVYYGLRLAGADPWTALVLGAAGPLIRVGVTAIRARRLERLGAFTLVVLTAGTVVGLFSADPRVLLARESWLTALVGVWLLASVFTSRPVLFDATVAVMPPAAAQAWRDDWSRNPEFRRIFAGMTLAWGAAFLLDAAARVVMAYTLPVDVVPAASVGLLVVMLLVIVQATKAYARHRLPRAAPAAQDAPAAIAPSVQ